MNRMGSSLFVFLALLAVACQGSVPGPNRPPVAVAGPDALLFMGDQLPLDASRSWDPDRDDLVYFAWEVLAAPAGAIHGGVIASPDQAQTLFTPTREGLWLVGLRVSDGRLWSDRDALQAWVQGEPCATDADCDDGLFCNGAERCRPGSGGSRCAPGQAVDCGSLDTPCARGRCDEVTRACRAEPLAVGSPCDDGLHCTHPDACDGQGQCAGPARVCAPSAACRLAACDEAQAGCVETPAADGTACDDGLFCSVDEACSSGACLGRARDCEAPGSCASGVCDEANRRCTGEPHPDGTPCDDGDRCTREDACQAGTCLGQPVDCGGLDTDCARGVCAPTSGACLLEPIREGQACDDGRFCSTDERCVQGACQPGGVADCSHLADLCNAGTCDPALDACVALPAREGEFCDDGLFCTLAERCVEGVCLPVTERPCPGGADACVLGVCDEETRSCALRPAQDGEACEDGDPCTLGDTCQAGACLSGPACPLGCDESATPPRCLEVALSNLEPDWLCEAGAPDFPPLQDGAKIDTDLGSLAGATHGHFHVQAQAGGEPGWPAPEIGVFVFRRVELPAGVSLQVVGSRALALVACEDLVLDGVLDASAAGQAPGPGGWAGGEGSRRISSGVYQEAEAGRGPGGGGRGLYQDVAPNLQSAGGGGAFGRDGGEGGDGTAPSQTTRPGGSRGVAHGPAALSPLWGGSGGGGGGAFNWAGPGGGGGGAVQLGAGGRIVIGPQGGIRTGGAGGAISSVNNWGAGSGGGAGGAILLEAPTVTLQGTLAANGGGGAGGRTDYAAWNLYCPEGTPTPGEDGAFAAQTAAGGLACSGGANRPAGAGGRGGALAGATQAGLDGSNGRAGGGGGGGVGRIRVNTFQGDQFERAGTTSPDCADPGTACSTGPLGLR
jgi:hypothetical protein